MNSEVLNVDSAFQFIKEVRKIASPGTYKTFIDLIENRYSSPNQKVNFGLIYLGVRILFINHDELYLKFIMFINYQHESLFTLIDKIVFPFIEQFSNLAIRERISLVKGLFSCFELESISNIDLILSTLMSLKRSSFHLSEKDNLEKQK